MSVWRDLLLGLSLSVAVHVLLLWPGRVSQAAEPVFAQGLSAVKLTLVPSRAARQQAPVTQSRPVAEPPNEVYADLFADAPLKTPRTPGDDVLQTAYPEMAGRPAPTEAVHANSPPPDIEINTGLASLAAIEQEGSLEEKGVLSPATMEGVLLPLYPPLSRKKGEEGSVLLEVSIRADGRPHGVRVLRSSGHKRLDRSAVHALENVRFTPARRLGLEVDSTSTFDVSFTLEDASR